MINERSIYQRVSKEIDKEVFMRHIKVLFGKPVLDYAKTLVINLPESCYCNCEYCIDKHLRKNCIETNNFLKLCERVLKEKHDFEEISITGGTLNVNDFNLLINIIQSYIPNVKITWNTNGVNIDNNYNISSIRYINLHRNSADDIENKNIFRCSKPIISIDDFKSFAKDKLCLRITVDKDFNIDDYVKYNLPLYLNRLLPETLESQKSFKNMLDIIDITENMDVRRRNHYLNGQYKNIPVRLCIGDDNAKYISGRYPMWLNVIIIHRNGVVSGSWYDDDKFLYKE